MYESYWGLSEPPFSNRLDERRFVETPVHEEALARLDYLIEQRHRCGVLSGPGGSGKSLLLGVLAGQIRRTQRDVAVVDLRRVGGHEMLWRLAAALHLAPEESQPSFALWRAVEDHLHGLRLARSQTVIIFDHFDRSEPDCGQILERLLNLENVSCGWTTTIVATRTVQRPLLSDLSDLRIELPAMNRTQTEQYVREGLSRVGCNRDLFNTDALARLFQQSQGIPRAVNSLCELSLLAAMGQERDVVDAEIVETAARELRPSQVRTKPRYKQLASR